MQRVDGNRVYFSSARETHRGSSCCRASYRAGFGSLKPPRFLFILRSYSTGATRRGYRDKRMSREEPFERVGEDRLLSRWVKNDSVPLSQWLDVPQPWHASAKFVPRHYVDKTCIKIIFPRQRLSFPPRTNITSFMYSRFLFPVFLSPSHSRFSIINIRG